MCAFGPVARYDGICMRCMWVRSRAHEVLWFSLRCRGCEHTVFVTNTYSVASLPVLRSDPCQWLDGLAAANNARATPLELETAANRVMGGG